MNNLRWYKQLYVQVIIAIFLGIVCGYFFPHFAVKMKPFGDGFIKLIRMMIVPIIFTTVVLGITKMKNAHEVGRVGIKALIYFEVLTTLALLLGLVVVNAQKPGAGLNIDIKSLDSHSIANYTTNTTANFNLVDFILNIIPTTFTNAFAKGDILPILFISILFGFGILHSGKKRQQIVSFFENLSNVLFPIVGFIMRAAPIGAFGAMAYTTGAHGMSTLAALSALVADVYLTSLLFIFVVLGSIARLCKFSLWNLLKYIKAELLIVLGTSSSETVLPQMISKLERLGCGQTVVGLVLPLGYTMNLDGTSIYLTMAILFIAQAFNIDLTLGQEFTIIMVLLITSKGAAAVAGGGFIVLAATLASLHTIPIEGIILLLGVDKFMSDMRALTNLVGNSVATIVIAKWEGDFDETCAKKMGVC